MLNVLRVFAILFSLVALSSAGEIKPKRQVENTVPVLWRAPRDIASRNLFYGPGGKRDLPHGTVTFEKEDMNGTNPKFIVRDRDGVRWTVKLGNEARPETVASRLVWAAGYFTGELYFVPDLRVEDMPGHLKRGGNLDTEGVRNVQLKRHDPGEKKDGDWSWRANPFRSTRELNGLRVLMALINNWDLKDVNNSVYREKGSNTSIYTVSDLGASFGASALIVPFHRSKDDLDEYRRSTFIRRKRAGSVDFGVPGRPSILLLLAEPMYLKRMRLEWIGRNVPRADAKWMGNILARLSPAQIRDAFRAGGYSPSEVEAFTKIVQSRIAQLEAL